MADVETKVEEVLAAATNASTNGTSTKVPATPEGMMIAYGSLVLMALLPIFFGAFRSVKHHKEQKASYQDGGERPETMSHKDAAMFPIIASCALFGLYVFFQVFSKEYINLLLTGYFFFLGILALTHILSPFVSKLVPAGIPNVDYHILFTSKSPGSQEQEALIDYKFTSHDLVCLAFSTLVGLWYIFKKHWIANNLFGMAFAINGVELLHLNNVVTGCILLGGLFFYDIFWVFGTNVMVTVAKSFEAPIKLVFPQDLLEKGLAADNFAMLGLGDIVLPGIFIALLLRFDLSMNRNSRTYFNTSFLAYIAGLFATIFVMHVYRHAQPALLYLVPACIGAPLGLALLKGDIKAMFQYEDHPAELKENEQSSSTKSIPPSTASTPSSIKTKAEARKDK
ncbi:minor histocompatibility antigen H13 [Folsomia candida]|uniref:Minor histocompatibility antigen H13 n=1 Tax=Folsomia candida TaxID=158441 RepID=A0A226F5U5_FOLCA|nr:minor histocompatibility antigen H13 [Folsomia candida]OXA65165.1 Minor histocompatibility antigen H13 [Folsomia candida]